MLTIAQILEATGGTLVQGSVAGKVRGVSTDTRTIKKGQLFVAIKGENHDAHGFLDQALNFAGNQFWLQKGLKVVFCRYQC